MTLQSIFGIIRYKESMRSDILEEVSKLKVFADEQVKHYSEALLAGEDTIDMVYKYLSILSSLKAIELCDMMAEASLKLNSQLAEALKDVDIKDIASKGFKLG